MKMSTITMMAAGALLVASLGAFAQDDDDDYILSVTRVGVKIGHAPKFHEALKPYHECLAGREDSPTWSAWRNVDGNPNVYHFVSTMANWAEMDTPNEAGQPCWSEHYQEITSHVESVSTMYARSKPEWSGDAEGYNVVRLFQFRVKDNRQFNETVSAITSILKEAEYEHLGSWYQVIGASSNEPGYFVVAHYENFAAMDEDRTGPYDVVKAHAGEERADELWAQFGDSLRDDWANFTELLRRVPELSRSGGG